MAVARAFCRKKTPHFGKILRFYFLKKEKVDNFHKPVDNFVGNLGIDI
jgi:hypothetical protein